MKAFIEPTGCEIASLFNSQKHIDDLKSGLEESSCYESQNFTFILKHKHFDLVPGEVLWVDKTMSGYTTCVKKLREIGHDVSPCMWMYAEGWKAFAYCSSELGYMAPLEISEGNYNVGLRWLNCGGTETTDEYERTQEVRPLNDEERSMAYVTTMLNWNGPESLCEKSKCVPQDNRTSHKRRHEQK